MTDQQVDGSSGYQRVFALGFPKSGTTTLQRALAATGYSGAHWRVSEGFVGQLMYEGFHVSGDPWQYLRAYDAITQGDVCLPGERLNYWPNLDFRVIEAIREKHPSCLFVMPRRDPKNIVDSMQRWTNSGNPPVSFQDRIKKCAVPGLPAGVGDDSELEEWIKEHYRKAREFFDGEDNFVEYDIADPEAKYVIERKLGVSLSWWGVANANPSKTE